MGEAPGGAGQLFPGPQVKAATGRRLRSGRERRHHVSGGAGRGGGRALGAERDRWRGRGGPAAAAARSLGLTQSPPSFGAHRCLLLEGGGDGGAGSRQAAARWGPSGRAR